MELIFLTDNMKKNYITPNSRTILVQGHALMTGGSMKVNEFKSGATINIGDSDDDPPSPSPSPAVRANRNYVDWDN